MSDSGDKADRKFVPGLAGKILAWMASGDTGTSSQCIAQTAMGNYEPIRWPSPPSDPADLGRCLRLLKMIPELRDLAFPILAKKKSWKPLIENWDKLAASMTKEVGIDWSKGSHAPKTYALMQKARGVR